MGDFLQLLWFFLLYVTLGLFVLLDGADLGIGVWSLISFNEEERSSMMSTIGPMWYANETWLVVGGATLFGAFPLAYALLLSSLYIPTMMLLFGLIFRAVSMEFRASTEKGNVPQRRIWGWGFGLGSVLATLGIGFLLGGVLSGLHIEGQRFMGGPWSWFNLPSVVTAAAVLAGFATLGAAYMVRRTEGEFQAFARRLARIGGIAALCLFIAMVVLLPLLDTPFREEFIRPPHVYAVPVFMALTLFAFAMLLRSVRPDSSSDAAPHVWGTVIFLGAVAAVIGGQFPYLFPFTLSIAQASAARQSLLFMIAGVGVILPIIIVYNLYARGIFRGKVRGEGEEEGY
jgi:cytochrome d ubiquinol oxidase subunit II